MTTNSNQSITIRSNNGSTSKTVMAIQRCAILDSLRKVIKRKSGLQLNGCSKQAGIYFIKVASEAGYTKKFKIILIN